MDRNPPKIIRKGPFRSDRADPTMKQTPRKATTKIQPQGLELVD